MTDHTSDGGRDDASSSCGSGPSDDDARSLDALFKVMADRRCRYVASRLESASVDVMELHDLVDYVEEREVEAGLDSDGEEHRQSIEVSLHHKQLPKMADAAIVDYDPRSKTLRYWGDDLVEAFVETFEDEDRV